jgi:acyl phosphate:glycerol-3-phosphate acyltransferase
MVAVVLVLLAYLSGSVPYGALLTKWLKGVDVRSAGSGNIGATNVARVAGRRLGVLVLLLDAAKGAVPVALCMLITPDTEIHSAVGFAAVLGHVFPVWLRFRGGKGVATAFGVIAVIQPWAALAGFAAYAVLFALFRVSSIGSLAGALTAAFVAVLSRGPRPYAILTLALFALLVFTHRGNIRRLLARAEKPI